MSYDDYVKEWNGKQVTKYGGQCVAGVAEFEAENNRPIVWGDASKWVNHPVMRDTYDWVQNDPNDANQLPDRGDIIVWDGNAPYTDGAGHIAFFDHTIDHLTFMSFGQNSGGATMHMAIVHWAHVAGWYSLKKVAPPPPPPAPAPAPPAPAPKPIPDYRYERLAQSMNVRVKPGKKLWDLNFKTYPDARELATLSTDPNNPTEFVAVGKATRQDLGDHPVYFMSNESFGNADVTGQPAFNQGVNTVDLEPVPAAAPPPPPTPPAQPTPAPVVDGDKIDVHVLPPNPDAWKATFKTNDAGDYTAEASTVVHDLDGKEADIQLVKGQTVHVAGKFTGPDGIEYYRTVNATNGWTDNEGVKHGPNWRGIPLASLKEDDAIYTFKDDLIDDFKELRGYIGTREKAVIAAAKIHGEVSWIAARLKKRGKK